MAHSIIFGGTYDPIHNGHLLTAQAARELLRADEIILVPAQISPHKLGQTPTAAADRLAMVRLAIQGVEGFRVYAGELERGGTSFTIDTIEVLHQENPGHQFTLLIGADQLPKLHTWHRVADILAQVQVAVLGRPDAEISIPQLENALGMATAQRLAQAILRTPMIAISATDIRARVAAGQSIHNLVAPAVEGYIHAHHLYDKLSD